MLLTPKPNAVMTSIAVAAARLSTLTEAVPSTEEEISQMRPMAAAAASAERRIAAKFAFMAACENAGATALRTIFHSAEAVS